MTDRRVRTIPHSPVIITRSVLVAILLAGTLCWPYSTAGAAQGARIDLNLFYDAPAIDPGGHGTLNLAVGDTGPDATGPAALTLTTPVFVSVDQSRPLPAGCAMAYASGDPEVPDVLRCVIPAPAHGKLRTVSVPVTVDTAAASGTTYGEATVVPAANSPDIEQRMADNIGWPSVAVTGSGGVTHAPARGHVTDLYLSTTLPALAVGRPAPATFTIGNRGPDATTGPIRLVVATPPFVQVDEPHGLPSGCDFRYSSPDPAQPQILRCVLPTAEPSGGQLAVPIPMAALWGAPVQTLWGISAVFPDRTSGSTDVDPVPANNVIESGVQVVG